MSLLFALFLASIPLDPVPKEPTVMTFKKSDATSSITGSTILSITPTTKLSIACDKGFIEINYATGEVKIPEGSKMPDAARAFWEQIVKAFPAFKKAIIEGEKAQKKNAK